MNSERTAFTFQANPSKIIPVKKTVMNAKKKNRFLKCNYPEIPDSSTGEQPKNKPQYRIFFNLDAIISVGYRVNSK